MDIHLKFQDGQQQKLLNQIEKVSGYSPSQLSELIDVHKRTYCDWKREKFSISHKAVGLFLEKFDVLLPESEAVLLNRWKAQKKSNARIGGLACYQKHGLATKEGRIKGGKAKTRKPMKTPNKNSIEFAEFAGIILGDGGITHGQITITLNSTKDSRYIPYVVSLCESLFDQRPKIYARNKYNACVIYYNRVFLVDWLLENGFKKGNKVTNQVGVPDWIKSREQKKACLRGLIDTDGGIFKHKYIVNNKEYSYHKLCFANRSMPLIAFVRDTLEEIGFRPKVESSMATKRVWLYNSNEAKEYLKTVGSNNPRVYDW